MSVRYYELYCLKTKSILSVVTEQDGIFVATVNGARLENRLTFGAVCYNAMKNGLDIIQFERHKVEK